MEIVIILFVLVGGSIALSAWMKSRSPDNSPSVDHHAKQDSGSTVRTCLKCGYEGEMKTWIANNIAPKLIAVAGFLLGYIPGLIFLAIYWGKYKCPSCKAIGKNQPVRDVQ
jgi:hypothetical protein